MKPLLLTLSIATALASTAQWSTDPAAPLVLCNAAYTQTDLKSLPDGTGGWFAFWTDPRTDGTHSEIYGQHLDAEGFALWAANGKLIHAEPGSSIDEIAAVALDDGNLLLAYLFRPSVYQDTLKAIAIDNNGDAVWSTPVHIAQGGSPVLGLSDLTASRSTGGAYIGWYDTYFGGSNGVNVTRINNDGTLPWGTDGYAIPNASYGPFELHDDYGTGVMVQWRTGNGSGAHLMVMRVNSTGANDWAANVQTSVGSGGLNYAFHTTQDGIGAQLTTWVDLPHLIVMARLDTTGALTFTPTPVPVCSFASDQDSPKLVVNNGYTFAAWTDNRPPASYRDLFLQKFDANGSPQWTPDGVPAIQINTYIPNSGLVVSDSGAVVATIDGNVDGYSAMRVRSNGSLAWPAPVAFCIPSFNPFYERQIQLPDGIGGVVSFWESSAGDLYAARIYRNGDLGNHVGVGENTNAGALHLSPNPAHDRITLSTATLDGDPDLALFTPDGRLMFEHIGINPKGCELYIGGLAPGAYILRIRTSDRSFVARFIKQ